MPATCNCCQLICCFFSTASCRSNSQHSGCIGALGLGVLGENLARRRCWLVRARSLVYLLLSLDILDSLFLRISWNLQRLSTAIVRPMYQMFSVMICHVFFTRSLAVFIFGSRLEPPPEAPEASVHPGKSEHGKLEHLGLFGS